MLAYCGLDCTNCEAFIATQENNDEKRSVIAQNWSKMYNADVQPEHINCYGCTSDKARFYHCDVCEIRNCCKTRKIDHCAQCTDYICDTLSEFIKLAPEAGTALAKLRD